MKRFAFLLPVAVMLLASSVSDVSGGSIICWGTNYYGQCDVPEPNEDFVAIAAGGWHTLGIKNDGSIDCWGYNSDGQCDVPLPNQDFVAISAGIYHSLGLKADGSIVCWGLNGSGQCDVPEPNQDFVVVEGATAFNLFNSTHSLGLKADGSIVVWGAALGGGPPEPNEDFIAIAGGSAHSLGLKSFNLGIETLPDPEILQIDAIYPNPVTSTTNVHFSSPGLPSINMEIYDMNGRMVRTIEIGTAVVGEHTVTWDGRTNTGELLCSGIYMIRITGDDIHSNASRVVLIR